METADPRFVFKITDATIYLATRKNTLFRLTHGASRGIQLRLRVRGPPEGWDRTPSCDEAADLGTGASIDVAAVRRCSYRHQVVRMHDEIKRV